MTFLKTLLGFVGRSFVGLGLTLFIFSFFLSFALGDIDVLESSLKESIIENIQSTPELDAFCELNPDDETCLFITNPDQVIDDDESFNDMMNNISSYGNYILIFRWVSILLFVIGFGLIYLVKKSLILTLYGVSFSSTITSALAIFYYRYLPAIFDKILNKMDFNYFLSGAEIPNEAFNMISNIINNWLYFPLQKTYNLAILITAAFLVITVVLFFIKKKGLYRPTKS